MILVRKVLRGINAIKKVETDVEIIKCQEIIKNSFITVADDFGLTIKNAPSNPEFITCESLQKSIEKGMDLYFKYENNAAVGCVGILRSSSSKEIYYIERLAVVPKKRHLGIGKSLLKKFKQNFMEAIKVGIFPGIYEK